MEAVKFALLVNTGLQSLFFWGIGMHNEGGLLSFISFLLMCKGSIVLAEALTENHTLFRIELRNNSIGLAGILAFRFVR
jgi:hypothetical protein